MVLLSMKAAAKNRLRGRNFALSCGKAVRVPGLGPGNFLAGNCFEISIWLVGFARFGFKTL
jgi:hypothetical protein